MVPPWLWLDLFFLGQCVARGEAARVVLTLASRDKATMRPQDCHLLIIPAAILKIVFETENLQIGCSKKLRWRKLTEISQTKGSSTA